MAWYRTGTVSVTNGSTAVTGSGTNFVAGAQVGEGFAAPDGRLYEIVTIVSATSLTIGKAYLGSTQTGQTYEIVPTQSLVADLAGQVSTLISDFQSVADEAGEGKFDYGTAASPGITFTLDQDTGFFHDTNNEIGVSAGGTKVAEFNSGGLSFPSGKGVAGNVTITGDLSITDELNLINVTNNFFDHHGTMRMRYFDGAVVYDTMTISPTTVVFNDAGRDLDFRIESDTNTNAFFLQGSDGKVGIGTGSPLQSLHVNSAGNTQLLISSSFNNSTNTGLTVDTVGDSSVFRLNAAKSGANQGVLSFSHNSSAGLQAWNLAISGSDVYKAGYSEQIWKTNNTERMRITSTGSVGIGTFGTSSPSEKLHLYQDSAFAIQMERTGGTPSVCKIANSGNLLNISQNVSGIVFLTGTTPTEKMRITAAGQAIIPNGVTLGTAAGTYNAANTLDDYEEGTWTPAFTSLSGDFGSIGYLFNYGSYTKVGRLVTVVGRIQTDGTALTIGDAGGALRVTGLPFNSAVSPFVSTVSVANIGGWNSNLAPSSAYVNPSSTFFSMFKRAASNTNETILTADEFISSGTFSGFMFSAIYYTA